MSFGKQNKLIWLSAHAVSTQWKGFYVAIKKNEVYLYSLIWNNNLDKLGIEGKFQFDNKYLQKTYN